MAFNETNLSSGTCFFWEKSGKRYLVTNWHNVSGKNPQTGKHINGYNAEPNKLLFDTWTLDGEIVSGWGWIDIYENDKPKWLEHPVYGRDVDVVAIELPDLLASRVYPINVGTADNVAIGISSEVFILGYPLGLGVGKNLGVERLPIWKRASVASEPDIDVDGLPKIYVDTASTFGMSGSPVIRRCTGSFTTSAGALALSTGDVTAFVGVYSGRVLVAGSDGAQLGIVWKARVIDEIVSGACAGSAQI